MLVFCPPTGRCTFRWNIRVPRYLKDELPQRWIVKVRMTCFVPLHAPPPYRSLDIYALWLLPLGAQGLCLCTLTTKIIRRTQNTDKCCDGDYWQDGTTKCAEHVHCTLYKKRHDVCRVTQAENTKHFVYGKLGQFTVIFFISLLFLRVIFLLYSLFKIY